MSSSATIFTAVAFTAAIDAVRAAAAVIPDDLLSIKGLDDSALLSTQRGLSELRRMIDSRSSAVAGEVAFRSRRDLGYTGLAQREGFGTAEKLIQNTTGSTVREATTLVAVGTMVHEAMIETAADPVTGELPSGYVVREPWLAAVGAAVAAGDLTIEKARAIKSGLGVPSVGGSSMGEASLDDVATGVTVAGITAAGVTVDDLTSAAARLLAEAGPLNADKLFSLARQYRDELDAAGIAQRERAIYEQRSFRRTKRPNGMPRYTFDPDLETAAYFDDLYDKLMSPRRGGPRFVDPADVAWAEKIATDERTNDQYLHDAFAGLIRLGVDADLADRAAWGAGSSPEDDKASRVRIVGSRIPAVRILVTENALTTRNGNGRIEGSDIPISIETVERAVCTAGTIPIRFSDEGNVLELGREARLFTGRQKIALAARDGGCIWPECDKSPGWTEAHHINQWARDGGRTDVCDGVLLCRHHHMLLHNNHWEIVRRGTDYWLVPPPEIDPARQPRQLHSKSAALRDLQRERERERSQDSGGAAPDARIDHSSKPHASARIEQLVS